MSSTHSSADVQRMLSGYSHIERCSQAMLKAARLADWPQVASIFESCHTTLRDVRRLNQTLVLSRTERKAKLQIIRQIIRNEAQIRRLASPWSDRYDHLMAGHPLTPSSVSLVV